MLKNFRFSQFLRGFLYSFVLFALWLAITLVIAIVLGYIRVNVVFL